MWQALHRQVAFFYGKAVLPVNAPLLNRFIDRFTKQFAIDADDLELRGRVDVRKGWLGNALYPLYFSVTPKPVTVTGAWWLCTNDSAKERIKKTEPPPQRRGKWQIFAWSMMKQLGVCRGLTAGMWECVHHISIAVF